MSSPVNRPGFGSKPAAQGTRQAQSAPQSATDLGAATPSAAGASGAASAATPSQRGVDTRPLRRTRRDLAITAGIAAVALVGVGAVWAGAPARHAHLTDTAKAAQQENLAQVPESLHESWRAQDASVPGVHAPVAANNVVLTANGHTVTAKNPSSGETLWEYQRDDRELCSIGTAWKSAVLTFRNGAGCGDVTSIRLADGTYKDTRSAGNSDQVEPVVSNDAVGTVSDQRTELWRSDLVRTVEYGRVPAPQEPKMQPHPGCTITSALTRKDNLAVTEVCPDSPGKTFLRLQDRVPDDARKPEVTKDFTVSSPGAYLVAVESNGAAVYIPGAKPSEKAKVQSFFTDKTKPVASDVDPVPNSEPTDSPELRQPATQDLPHNMSWFDGARLHLFVPGSLEAGPVIDHALGLPEAIGEDLLVPVNEGIAVVNPHDGTQRRVIPVDRGGYTGEVSLKISGDAVLEKRGAEIVALR